MDKKEAIIDIIVNTTIENQPLEVAVDEIIKLNQDDLSKILNKIIVILNGIDLQETYNNNGWWETSGGANFGKKKLEEIIELFSPYSIKKINEKQYICPKCGSNCHRNSMYIASNLNIMKGSWKCNKCNWSELEECEITKDK